MSEYRVTFPLGSMGEAPLAFSHLTTLLQSLVAADVMYLTAHPEVPNLSDAGITVVATPPSTSGAPWSVEDYKDVPTILLRDKRTGLRTARNPDLVAWAAAEAIVRGKLSTKDAALGVMLDLAKHAYKATLQVPNRALYAPGMPTPYTPWHRVTFVTGLFDGDKERELSHRTLDVLLAALLRIDMTYLRAHPETPDLYQSGVYYQEEPPGQEDWQDVWTSLRMKAADCEDLAAWRAAELNVRLGIRAVPKFIFERRKDGSYLYHIQVQLPDGRVEDPSRVLGMR